MRWDKLTTRGREALQDAIARAEKAGHPEVTPEHLLLSLLEQPDGIAPSLLGRIGVQPGAVAAPTQKHLDKLPRSSGAGIASPGLSRELGAGLEEAFKV